MAKFPETGGSNGTWGDELRAFFTTYFNLDTGDVNTDALIPSNSLDGSKIVDASLDGSKIANASVTATQLGTGAVTEDKIGAGAVTEDKIGAGAVTESKITSVNGSTVLDSTITSDKLSFTIYTDTQNVLFSRIFG